VTILDAYAVIACVRGEQAADQVGSLLEQGDNELTPSGWPRSSTTLPASSAPKRNR
jgi:hypothetical protein